jgi:hypothetical protein
MVMSQAQDAPAPSMDAVSRGRSAFLEGDVDTAATLFDEAARADPGDFEARYWLASAMLSVGAADAARGLMADAQTLQSLALIRSLGSDMLRFQGDRAYAADLGHQLYAARLMGPASVAFGRALDPDNLDLNTLLSYGLSLQHQGRVEEAMEVFSAAVELSANSVAHEFFLYSLFFVPGGVQRYPVEARRWAALYANGLSAARPAFGNERSAKRRLRVGYVAPTFTGSQLKQFITPVLDSHDPTVVELVLYGSDPDSETKLPPHAKIRKIGGLSDEAVAAMVRRDRIDVLVDLWGHTAGSRLRMFAMRPAPVQVAWMNFVQTTGLDAIDYVIHCDSMEVDGSAALFSERIWSAGEVMAPYRPAADRPEPTPTPALANGYVTFGSFINPAKISDATVAGWARILRGAPAARMVLKYGPFVDPVLQRATRARFAAHGVDAARLEFRGHSTGGDYLLEFRDIDLALDTSPCPGGTTTCDALSNGVPVLTLAGDDFYSRIGLNAVLACGLPELIAQDWDDYVARALALTQDAVSLNALRTRVRPGFEASAFRDEAGFTRRIESDFRRMFELWLAEGAERGRRQG